MNTTATMNGHHGALRITILGFEFPEATDADREWLVARVEWESPTARITHQGAFLLTTELDELAAALAGPGRPRCRALRFTEPGFSMTRSASFRWPAPERVTIAIQGAPREGGPAFEVSTPVSTDELRTFGRQLQRIAASLRARARAWPAAA